MRTTCHARGTTARPYRPRQIPLLLAGLAGLIAAAAPARAAGPLTTAEAQAAPHAPTFRVVDTVSSLGPLAKRPREITLADLVRFHGHPCDGLVVAAAGLARGLRTLFPGGVIDRTDLEVAVNGSACYGDVAAYLTGARHRYGSLVVDPKLGDEWILPRLSTNRTVRVRLRDGIKPAELPRLEARLRGGGCPPELIARVQAIQKAYALRVLSMEPARAFAVECLDRFPYPDGKPRPDAAKARCEAAAPRAGEAAAPR